MNPERSSPRYEDSCCMLLPSAMYLIISYFKMSLFFPVCIVFLCLWEKEQRIGVCFLFSCVSPKQGRRPVASRSAHWVLAVGPLAELDA